jgi:hypothetical protein
MKYKTNSSILFIKKIGDYSLDCTHKIAPVTDNSNIEIQEFFFRVSYDDVLSIS